MARIHIVVLGDIYLLNLIACIRIQKLHDSKFTYYDQDIPTLKEIITAFHEGGEFTHLIVVGGNVRFEPSVIEAVGKETRVAYTPRKVTFDNDANRCNVDEDVSFICIPAENASTLATMDADQLKSFLDKCTHLNEELEFSSLIEHTFRGDMRTRNLLRIR